MLAAARGAVLVPTVPPSHQPLRQQVDQGENVEARLCFYLSALFTAAEEIRRHLAAGTPVVVESYFARCITNHDAFGARLRIALPPDLPQPVTYYLCCAEKERGRRLARRAKPTSRWDVLSETLAPRIAAAYAQFPMRQIDSTGRTPEQVVQEILTAEPAGRHGVDTKPLGTQPHVLPVLPRRREGSDAS
ncbi:hypothetical protein ACGFRB_11175 [Streptomyces sp. NPDC048718]|uniref:hypothetical protein n=1 Tax=Streptomyces sp. NPDC048718 TaxID=3365587 RepID=UPI0037229C14